MGKGIKIFVGILLPVVILGGGGAGLYFSGLLDKKNNPSETEISGKLVPTFNQNKPNVKDWNKDFDFNCNYGLNTDGSLHIPKDGEDTSEYGNIVCLYEDKGNSKTNNFPLINFDEIRNLLAPGLTDPKERDKKAREKARSFSKKIMEKLSFGPELALLDEIIFTRESISKGDDAAGIYETQKKDLLDLSLATSSDSNSKDVFKQNRRTIRIKIRNSEKDPWNEGDIMQSLSHEYGHHVTLYNKKLNAQSFYDKLNELFGSQNDFDNFSKIYKQFNGLNDDRKFQDSDALKIYRKKYSANVVDLHKAMVELKKGTSEQKVGEIEDLLDKAKKIKLTNLKGKLEAVLNIINNKKTINKTKLDELISYLETNKYYVYYVDMNQAISIKQGSGKFPKNYYFMPSSIGEVVNSRQDPPSPLKIKDIFDWGQIVNENKDYKDKPTEMSAKEDGCLELPLNFASLAHINFEANLFQNEAKEPPVSNKNKTPYELISEEHDKTIIERLKYYYSFRELSARLFSVLTYSYDDQRQTLPTCHFNYSIKDKEYLAQTANGEDAELYSDFSMFKAFGMDILEENKAKKLYQFLTGIEGMEKNGMVKNTAYIFSNNRKIKEQEDKTNPRNYFLSFNRVGIQQSNVKYNWTTVFLNGIVKLENEQSTVPFKVLAEYTKDDGTKFYRTPMTYNYNKYRYKSTKVSGKKLDLDNQEYKELLKKDGEMYIGLVFPLYFLYGEIENNGNYRVKSWLDDINKLDKIFASPKLIFIDKDGDGKFTEQKDIKLEIQPL